MNGPEGRSSLDKEVAASMPPRLPLEILLEIVRVEILSPADLKRIAGASKALAHVVGMHHRESNQRAFDFLKTFRDERLLIERRELEATNVIVYMEEVEFSLYSLTSGKGFVLSCSDIDGQWHSLSLESRQRNAEGMQMWKFHDFADIVDMIEKNIGTRQTEYLSAFSYCTWNSILLTDFAELCYLTGSPLASLVLYASDHRQYPDVLPSEEDKVIINHESRRKFLDRIEARINFLEDADVATSCDYWMGSSRISIRLFKIVELADGTPQITMSISSDVKTISSMRDAVVEIRGWCESQVKIEGLRTDDATIVAMKFSH